MKVFCVFLFGSLLLALGACHCHNRVCPSFSSLSPVFVGYDSADIDTLLLVKYERADSFKTVVDTLVLDSANVQWVFKSDSTSVTIQNDSFKITSEYDWQLFIPATGDSSKIYDVSTELRKYYTCEPDDPGCVNRILSFRQDGNTYSGLYEYRYCYIHK